MDIYLGEQLIEDVVLGEYDRQEVNLYTHIWGIIEGEGWLSKLGYLGAELSGVECAVLSGFSYDQSLDHVAGSTVNK